MRIFKVLGASAVALVCAASTQPQHVALAQGMMQQTQAAPPTVRVRGTITSIDGKTLTVKARDGAEMKVNLLDNAPVNEVVKATLADVKTGAYVSHRHAATRWHSKGACCFHLPGGTARAQRGSSTVGF